MILDLLAVAVLLLVEGPLLLFGNMAVVLRSHIPLFLTHFVVVALEMVSFGLAHFAVFDLVVDPTVLVVETAVDLRTAGMVLVPFTVLCEGGGGEGQQGNR